MDWKKLIADLSAAGWTQAQIAEHMGRSQSWVSKVATQPGVVALGKDAFDVGWHDGEKLRKLHARVMRKSRTAE